MYVSLYSFIWLFVPLFIVIVMLFDLILEHICDKTWGLLPDRCCMADCSRKGWLFFENKEDGKFICDYCSVKYYLTKQGLIDG